MCLTTFRYETNAQEFSKKDFRKSQQEIKKCTKRMFHITSAGKAILDRLSMERNYFHKCTKVLRNEDHKIVQYVLVIAQSRNMGNIFRVSRILQLKNNSKI